MKINHVHAVYFSPTGNAKKVVTTLAQAIADTLGVPMDSYDFTLPESREKVHTYGADDLLVIGTRSTRDASRTRCSHLYRPILRKWRARHSGGCLRKP